MSKPYNSHAKIQDKLLWEAMEDVTEYAFENLGIKSSGLIHIIVNVYFF